MSDKKSLSVIGDDLEALFDTLDGCDDPLIAEQIEAAIKVASMDLSKKVDSTAHVLSRWEYEADRLDDEIKRLTAKKKAIENHSNWLKTRVLEFLKAHDQPLIKGEFSCLARRLNPPAVTITDEGIIPAKFIEIIPATTRIRKADIAATLKQNVPVPGAELTQGERLERK